jgi:hypothetical protein
MMNEQSTKMISLLSTEVISVLSTKVTSLLSTDVINLLSNEVMSLSTGVMSLLSIEMVLAGGWHQVPEYDEDEQEAQPQGSCNRAQHSSPHILHGHPFGRMRVKLCHTVSGNNPGVFPQRDDSMRFWTSGFIF